MVLSNIRDLRAHIALDELPTQQSVEGWQISPYRLACSENERGLYDDAV